MDFRHGLGDAVHFALSLPLWIRRGHPVEVSCTPGQNSLFRAAGAKIVPAGALKHRFSHPPDAPPGHPWNKPAHNLQYGGLPQIGTAVELWPEYLTSRLRTHDLSSPTARRKIRQFLGRLRRPVIVTHFEGLTSKELKDMTAQEQAAIVRELPGSVVPCSVAKTVGELFELIQGADLLVSIDSGPVHLSRLTSTQAIGLWVAHHPQWYALPRPLTTHVVSARYKDWNVGLEWNFVTYEGPRPDIEVVRQTIITLLRR